MAGVPQPEGDELLKFSGRKFHRFSLEHTVYCVPIDQSEQQRLDQLDEILHQVFRERLILPDIPTSEDLSASRRSSSFYVLDCGCGRGAWIDRLMEENSRDYEMTGVDLYFGRAVDEDDDDDDNEDDSDDENDNGQGEVQEYEKKRWNLNARFRDAPSEDQLRPESFDLINSRLLADGINAARWPSYIRDLKHMLKHGGWLQMVEMELLIQSSTGRLDDNSHLTRWWQWYSSMMQNMGKNPRIGRELRQHLQTEGFAHIQGGSIEIPIGAWKPGQESLGEDALTNVQDMLTSLSLWPFLRIGGMSQENYRALITGCTAELHDPSKRLYYKV